MPYAQAHIEIEHDGTIHLFSYVTRVAMIDADGWLTIFGLYSQTTKRHIGCFMVEYANSTYYLAKTLYSEKLQYNIHTGEVVEIA
jgi:hypothetical protein